MDALEVSGYPGEVRFGENQANALQEMWARGEREHREKRRREHREQWLEFFSSMEKTHLSLAQEHRLKAEALQAEPETEGGGVCVSGGLRRHQAERR